MKKVLFYGIAAKCIFGIFIFKSMGLQNIFLTNNNATKRLYSIKFDFIKTKCFR